MPRPLDPTPHMDAPPLPERPVRREPRGWPRLSLTEQRTIRRFLAWYALQAQKAEESAVQMLRISGDDPAYQGSADYWRHAFSAIKWLNHRTTVRQEYLTLPDPTEEEGRA